MRFKSLARRRPSAPLIISFAALFVALGGVGYAATQLPANSVGSAQLKNGSVGNWKLKFNAVGARKIINGAVGAKQVNSTQVQLRVTSNCSSGAISAVGLSGSVTCTPALPKELGTNAAAVKLPTTVTPQTVATQSLPAGSSYLVLAYPHLATQGGPPGAYVQVDCSLSVGTSAVTQRWATDLDSESGRAVAGTIPLVLPVGSASSVQTATVSCTDNSAGVGTTHSVSVDTTITAIQTASNS